MLKNTRIIVRLGALLGAMLILMGGLSVVGVFGMAGVRESLRTVYEDRVGPLEQPGQIQFDHFQVRIPVIDAVNVAHVEAINKDAATIDDLVKEASGMWKAYLATYLTPEEKILADATQKSFDTYDDVRGRVLGTLKSGDFAGGKALAKGEGGPAL